MPSRTILTRLACCLVTLGCLVSLSACSGQKSPPLTLSGSILPDVLPQASSSDITKKAREYRDKELYTESLFWYDQVVKKEGKTPPVLLEIAQVYADMDRIDKAISILADCTKQIPNCEAYQGILDLYLLRKGGTTPIIPSAGKPYSELIKGVQKLYKGDLSDLGQAWEKSAAESKQTIYAAYAAAFLDVEKKAGVFSEVSPAYRYVLYAKVALDHKEYPLAALLAKKAVELRKEYVDAWVVLGYSYYHMGTLPQAKSALIAASGLDPLHPQVLYLLGLTHMRLGSRADAISALEKAYHQKYEPKARLVEALSSLYIEDKRYEKAAMLYEDLWSTSAPKTSDEYVHPINIYLTYLHDTAKAELLAKNSEKLFPTDAMTYNLLAWVAIAQKDFDRALDYTDRALKIDPQLQAALYNRAQAQDALGYKEEALSSYEKAYAIDPESSLGKEAQKQLHLR